MPNTIFTGIEFSIPARSCAVSVPPWISRGTVKAGWVKVPVPLLVVLLVPANGPANASLFASVSATPIPLAPVAVGLTLKLSPNAMVPLPSSARVKPSMVGGGVALISKVPMALPSERNTVILLGSVLSLKVTV